jgi:hypothetical protein
MLLQKVLDSGFLLSFGCVEITVACGNIGMLRERRSVKIGTSSCTGTYREI